MASINDYGDLHRATLQTLMGYGTIEEKLLKKIILKLARKYLPNVNIEAIEVERIMEMINEKISRFDQKVTKFEYGLNNENFFVFHTTASTAMSKMQSSYKENELDFFKALFTAITDNDSLSIAPRDALNLSTQITGKINKLRAQKLLEIWTSNHYFFKHTDDRIYLGAKVLTEFKDFLLQKELENLKCCMLCETIAIWGPGCPHCHVIFHATCLETYRARTENCPSCRSKLSEPPVVDADD